jgi:hypothetical protein
MEAKNCTGSKYHINMHLLKIRMVMWMLVRLGEVLERTAKI